MKTTQEFMDFYVDDLLPKLKSLEKKRKKTFVVTISSVTFLGIIFCILFIASLFYLDIKPEHYLYIIAISSYPFLKIFSYHRSNKLYRQAFKAEIIKPIIHFLNSNLEYQPEKKISPAIIEDSKLFPKPIDELKGDDLVCGKIGSTEIIFSEVSIRFENANASLDSSWLKDIKRNSDIGLDPFKFTGLFIIVDFYKDFKKSLFVLPEKPLIPTVLYPSRKEIFGKRIKVDNIEFENVFDVYGEDEIEAMYILTPNLMERILKIKNTCGNLLLFSFINSKLYIAIAKNRALFEPSYFLKIDNPDEIKRHFEDLQLAIGVVENLNLNTRIWTKE